MRGPKVWKECEDFWRDSADWRGGVSPGSNQAKDLESVLLEKVELEQPHVSHDPYAGSTRLSDLSHVWGHCDAVGSNFSCDPRDSATRTYPAPKTVSCMIRLVERRC